MFWMRNEENSFTIHTLIWRPGEAVECQPVCSSIGVGLARSSKSRTSDQQEHGKEGILDTMVEAPEAWSTFAFTDGSCLTNPGPCGAGSVIYKEHHPYSFCHS